MSSGSMLMVTGGVIVAVVLLFGIASLMGLASLDQVGKIAVADAIGAGTLGLSGIALVFLGLTLAQRQQSISSTHMFNLYTKLSVALSLLVMFSVVDAVGSLSFLILKWDLAIYTSVLLLLLIAEILVVSCTVVAVEQLGR